MSTSPSTSTTTNPVIVDVIVAVDGFLRIRLLSSPFIDFYFTVYLSCFRYRYTLSSNTELKMVTKKRPVRSTYRSLEATLFGRKSAQLRAKRRFLQPHHAVFCSFENRFAKSGGLAAVVVNTLPFLKETTDLKSVSLMTPFYPSLMNEDHLERTGVCFKVAYAGDLVATEILRYVHAYSEPKPGSVVEYYLKADGFFVTRNRICDPYIYVEGNSDENERQLRNSALFFCAAVPAALAALDLGENVVLHLQEWQTALLAFTSKQAMLEGRLRSCATIQTMHNPYDCFIPRHDLQRIIVGKSQYDRMERTSGVPDWASSCRCTRCNSERAFCPGA